MLFARPHRRRSLWAAVLVVAALFAAALGPRQAARAQSYPGGVLLCSGTYYGGRCQAFAGDVANLSGTIIEREAARSLRLAPGWFISVYRRAGFQGRCETFFQDIPDLDGTYIGAGTTTSFRVNAPCTPTGGPVGPIAGVAFSRGVVLCSDYSYTGNCELFLASAATLDDSFVGNESAVSLRVAPGTIVSVYSQPYFQGRCQTFYQDAPDLDATYIGSGAIASLQLSATCPAQPVQPPVSFVPPSFPPPPPPQPPPAPLPATPQNVRVSSVNGRSIDFAWSPSANAAGYWIYAPWPSNAEVLVGGTSYSLRDLPAGGFYCLTVIAYNASGYSSWSIWACVTVP